MKMILNFVLFWVMLREKSVQSSSLIISEVSTDSSSRDPYFVCRCATSDDCYNEDYEDWLVVEDGFLRNFQNRNKTFQIKGGSELDCDGVENCPTISSYKNILVIGTGNLTSLNNILRDRKQIVFCQQSIDSSMTHLTIKYSKSVSFTEEVFKKRNSILYLTLSNINEDILFPSALYDFDYIADDFYFENEENTDKSEPEKVIFDIKIIEVGNVTFNSNTIKTDGVKLYINFCKCVTIEPFAISDKSPLSGITLRNIDNVLLKGSWGVYIIIEFCKTVEILPHSISFNLIHLTLKDIYHLINYENSLNLSHIKFISLFNIKSWLFTSETIVNTSSAYLESVLSKKSTLYIDSVNMTIMISNDIEIISENIILRNSSYKKIGSSNTSVYFTGVQLQIQDHLLPSWITFCQIVDSTCMKDFNSDVCWNGVQYPREQSLFNADDCVKVSTQTGDDYNQSLYWILGFGLVVCCVMVSIAAWLICVYSRMSGYWAPVSIMNNDESYSRKERYSTFSKTQILRVPSKNSQIIQNFPPNYAGKLEATRIDGAVSVNMFAFCDFQYNQDEVKFFKKKIKPVELIQVRTYDEEEDEEFSDVDLRN